MSSKSKKGKKYSGESYAGSSPETGGGYSYTATPTSSTTKRGRGRPLGSRDKTPRRKRSSNKQ